MDGGAVSPDDYRWGRNCEFRQLSSGGAGRYATDPVLIAWPASGWRTNGPERVQAMAGPVTREKSFDLLAVDVFIV